MMEVKTKTIEGKQGKELTLPNQFSEPIRKDLIKLAVLALQSNRRQPYGAKPEAGKRASAELSRRRHNYRGSYGFGISRVPRKIFSRRGTRMNWEGAFAPGTRGGRRAHPPKAEKIWTKKINKKERRKAIRSALSASVIPELVKERGHLVKDYPLIIDDKFENLEKTKDAKKVLEKLGLKEELERCSIKKIRAGKGKARGRKYRTRKGPLLVVSKECKLMKAASNIPGIDIEIINNINAELLAPGTVAGRATIYTESAIKKIEEERLFTNYPVKKEIKKEEKKADGKEVKEKKVAKKKVTKKKEEPKKEVKKVKEEKKPKEETKKKKVKKTVKKSEKKKK